MTIVELLRNAKALIATPESFCKGALAKDANGKCVSYFSPEASLFCSKGAMNCAYGRRADEVSITDAYALLYKVGADILKENNLNDVDVDVIFAVNDRLGFQAVHEMFDRAIALAPD